MMEWLILHGASSVDMESTGIHHQLSIILSWSPCYVAKDGEHLYSAAFQKNDTVLVNWMLSHGLAPVEMTKSGKLYFFNQFHEFQILIYT